MKKKFKMSTEEFIKRYDKGEFEDREDYPGHELFRWRSDYRSLLRLKSTDLLVLLAISEMLWRK